jgi:predicted nucleic acid-binding protein
MTLQADLGKGESECIVLAKEMNADFVVLDDKDARKMAEFLGLDVIGTLGILVMAHKKGEIKNLKSVIDEVRGKNFWMDDNLYNKILKEIM